MLLIPLHHPVEHRVKIHQLMLNFEGDYEQIITTISLTWSKFRMICGTDQNRLAGKVNSTHLIYWICLKYGAEKLFSGERPLPNSRPLLQKACSSMHGNSAGFHCWCLQTVATSSQFPNHQAANEMLQIYIYLIYRYTFGCQALSFSTWNG